MKIKILALLVFGFILFAGSATAWNCNTHKFLWQEAMKDVNLSDCDKSETKKILNTAPCQPDKGGSKDRHMCFQDYCPALIEMNKLISQAKNETDFCNKAFILGKASHYLTDSLNPVHQKLVSNNCHTKFESGVWKWIKSGSGGNFTLKCGRGKGQQVFQFDRNNLDEIKNRIKEEILPVLNQ